MWLSESVAIGWSRLDGLHVVFDSDIYLAVSEVELGTVHSR